MTAWSGLGITMGNRAGTDISVLIEELIKIQSFGINKLRLVSDTDYQTWIDKHHEIAIAAKNLGMYVYYGATRSTEINEAGWPSYVTAITEEAEWAQENEMDEFCIGNELEIKEDAGWTNTDVKNNLLTLATTIQAVFTRGPISVTVSNGSESLWSLATLGDIDKLGFNVYGDGGAQSNFRSRAQAFFTEYGNERGFITEWNVDSNESRTDTIFSNQELAYREVAQRQRILQDIGFTDTYFFCWKYANVNESFSAYRNDGTYQYFWNVLATNNKRNFFFTDRYFNALE